MVIVLEVEGAAFVVWEVELRVVIALEAEGPDFVVVVVSSGS